MQDQNLEDQVIQFRRKAAEYYQKAAWNQLLALDYFREKNYTVAERFAQMSFEDQMTAMEYAELADAESAIHQELELEE